RQGIDVTYDMHTRSFGTTNLSAALPPWVLEGNQATVAARLRDPDVRRRLKTYRSIITGLARGNWHKIVLFDCKRHPECAVRRLTSLPAGRLGLKDRGILRPGAWADVIVFNPAVFGERGTTFEPNQAAAGMVHVLVNGRITLKDGMLTGNRAGQVLRS